MSVFFKLIGTAGRGPVCEPAPAEDAEGLVIQRFPGRNGGCIMDPDQPGR